MRNLSLLIEYPFAHGQTQDKILHQRTLVEETNRNFIQSLMHVQTKEGREQLARLGYQLQHMFVFDGLPQFFPTETGGYVSGMNNFTNPLNVSEATFLHHGGYTGWRPELGSACRGPLPPHVPLKKVAVLIRRLWLRQGFRKREWYGPIWEFANMFWWQSAGWVLKHQSNETNLDCTHAFKGDTPLAFHGKGLYGMHKYFWQAMIDDYFEMQQQATRSPPSQ